MQVGAEGRGKQAVWCAQGPGGLCTASKQHAGAPRSAVEGCIGVATDAAATAMCGLPACCMCGVTAIIGVLMSKPSALVVCGHTCVHTIWRGGRDLGGGPLKRGVVDVDVR
jgi:hypothetical protein